MNEYDKKLFGGFIRRRRQHVFENLSLSWFAERIGISKAYLSRIELGYEIPTEDVIKLIAEELFLDTDFLLSMAGKISSDLVKIIIDRPSRIVDLLRICGELDRKKLELLFATAQTLGKGE